METSDSSLVNNFWLLLSNFTYIVDDIKLTIFLVKADLPAELKVRPALGSNYLSITLETNLFNMLYPYTISWVKGGKKVMLFPGDLPLMHY